MGQQGQSAVVPLHNSELVTETSWHGVIPSERQTFLNSGLQSRTEPEGFRACPQSIEKSTHVQEVLRAGFSGGLWGARIVPIASANDGRRFNTYACRVLRGVRKWNPSRGLNPMGPDYGEGWEGAVAGPLIAGLSGTARKCSTSRLGTETGAPYRVSRTARKLSWSVQNRSWTALK
jgi:amidase